MGRASHSTAEAVQVPSIDVLLIDDDPDDYVITRDLLLNARQLNLEWIDSAERAINEMATNRHQVYLLDFHLGALDGLTVWEQATASGCQGAVIFLTGEGGRDIDLVVMDRGAHDYIAKEEVTAERLERAIRYAYRSQRRTQELQSLASSDTLTGLLNQAGFRQQASLALARSIRNKTSGALLFIDLDGFKPINDTVGHQAGDEVLRVVAQRLRETVRHTDVIGRVGGDEFAVVLERVDGQDNVRAIADKVLESICQPIEAMGQVVRVGASIGASMFPRDGMDVERLIQRADTAMYHCKQTGGRQCAFYEADMQTLTGGWPIDLLASDDD
ncbi:MAG: diguanylate cyclase response regulator [Deltaproteobacteria bacterium]|nr:diguanylate cyclase response regulator [Deltaproteobacteria bacterium]